MDNGLDEFDNDSNSEKFDNFSFKGNEGKGKGKSEITTKNSTGKQLRTKLKSSLVFLRRTDWARKREKKERAPKTNTAEKSKNS